MSKLLLLLVFPIHAVSTDEYQQKKLEAVTIERIGETGMGSFSFFFLST